MVSMMQTPAKKQVSTTCNNAVGLITIALDTEIQPDLRTSPDSGQGGTKNGRRLQQGTTAPAVSGTKRKPDGPAPGQPSAKQQNTGSYQNAASKPAQSVSGVLQQVLPPDTPPAQISGGGGSNAPSNQASNQAPGQYKTATAPHDYFGDLNSRTNPHSGQARVAPFTSPPDSDYFGDLKSNTNPHTGEVRDGSLPSPPHT
ncbi:hypothetical protein B9Z65_5025 [Elsinoe australis]|uniref:Uncharacterized protein n=1 Tax=Elsinoe australis TaxID=40998 RepID=A0A2P7ZCU7_9PEZI|nr:hypothetical protein B9Z65_5025 [Elsinoe australis]